ncbi:FxLYD domain-containing protein [Streptomyces cinereoruber]|uniref:FxLYD domain-containing protein n=1 Tax=Streptomyces cinereoruber TaxID=67260 RepID=UPI0036360ED1
MRRVMLPVLAAVVAAAALTACTSDDDGGDAAKNDTATATSSMAPERETDDAGEAPAVEGAKDVKIVKSGVEDHPTWGPKAYVVRYEITNHGDEAANYFVQLEFLDADGDVLGSTGVTADKLGPGKTSRGDSAPLDVEIQNGKISDIRSVRVSQVDRT